jgi:hypothetical protein
VAGRLISDEWIVMSDSPEIQAVLKRFNHCRSGFDQPQMSLKMKSLHQEVGKTRQGKKKEGRKEGVVASCSFEAV